MPLEAAADGEHDEHDEHRSELRGAALLVGFSKREEILTDNVNQAATAAAVVAPEMIHSTQMQMGMMMMMMMRVQLI